MGVVVRDAPKISFHLAYFVGNRWDVAPSLEDVQECRASDAVMVVFIQALHLFDGSWPVIGRLPNWKREEWPIPYFKREHGSPSGVLVRYTDDLLKWAEVKRCPGGMEGYEHDGAIGAGIVVNRLSKLIVGD